MAMLNFATIQDKKPTALNPIPLLEWFPMGIVIGHRACFTAHNVHLHQNG